MQNVLGEVGSAEELVASLDKHFLETDEQDIDVHLPEGIVVKVERGRYTKAREVLEDDIELLVVALIDREVNRQRNERIAEFVKGANGAEFVDIDPDMGYGVRADGTQMELDESAVFVHTSNYPEGVELLDREIGLLVLPDDKYLRLLTVENPPVKAGDKHGDKKEGDKEEGGTKEAGSEHTENSKSSLPGHGKRARRSKTRRGKKARNGNATYKSEGQRASR